MLSYALSALILIGIMTAVTGYETDFWEALKWILGAYLIGYLVSRLLQIPPLELPELAASLAGLTLAQAALFWWLRKECEELPLRKIVLMFSVYVVLSDLIPVLLLLWVASALH